MYRRNKQARLLTGGLIGVSTDTTLGDEHWYDVNLLLDGSTASLTTDASTAGNDPTNSNVTSTTATITGFASASDVFSFDGSGDYLTLPSNFTPELGTGDFTVECWLKASNTTGTKAIFDCRVASGDTRGWVLYINGTSLIHSENGGFNLTATSAVTASTWHHVALVRSSNTTTLFVDGSSVGTVDVTGKSYDFENPLTIGVVSYVGSSVGDFAGNLANIRITKGVARYTQKFKTPVKSFPVQPLGLTVPVEGDDFWDDVVLHVRGDTLTDLSANGHTLTAVNEAAAGDADTKYSSGSLSFDGVNDGIDVTASNLPVPADGGFTIEAWAKWGTATPSAGMQIAAYGDDAANKACGLRSNDTNNGYRCFFWADNLDTGDITTGGDAVTFTDWHHVAVTFDGTTRTIWVNGVSRGSDTPTWTLTVNDNLSIGYKNADLQGPGEYWNGNLEDIRITKGVARYTQNFTPPTASFLTKAPSTTTTGRRGVGEIDNSIEYLIVGGGGGGGGDVASGGGAGGVIAGSSAYFLNSGPYSVSIGAGGAGATVPATDGVSGGDTTAFGLTALGGGGGGGGAGDGNDGGSGGGGNPVGSGTGGQGNDGGLPLHSTPYFNGGGGGGKTSAGSDATTSKAGDGGDGILWLDGNYYGGGGGGGWLDNTGAIGSLSNRGDGGLGGGGSGGVSKGSTVIASATSGAANTGGGGGGGGWQSGSNDDGGSGGSGVVLMKYPSGVTLTISGGLTATHDTTTLAGYTITKFTAGSGTAELTGDPAATLRTRGYIGAAPAGSGGMLTLYDSYIDTLA